MPADSTPYKIRADLLNLAREILAENMHVKLEVARRAKKTPQVSGYTSEDVIAEAEKLYAFVNKK